MSAMCCRSNLRHKNHIDGIVHGWSQSGATVYVEPKSVVEANNRFMLAQSEVDVEVDRILRAMSIQVGCFSSELQENIRILGQIDLIGLRWHVCVSASTAQHQH